MARDEAERDAAQGCAPLGGALERFASRLLAAWGRFLVGVLVCALAGGFDPAAAVPRRAPQTMSDDDAAARLGENAAWRGRRSPLIQSE